MRAKLLLAMLAVLSLHSVALAQGYSIQLTYNTNLRAGASLQGQHSRNGTFWHYAERSQRIESLASNQPKRKRSVDGKLGQSRARLKQHPDTDINADHKQYRQLLFCGPPMQYRPRMDGRLLGFPEWTMRRGRADADLNPACER